MNDQLFLTIQEILATLQAVTAELHKGHVQVAKEPGSGMCREESCLSFARLEAQVDSLRRACGIASFRMGS